jgi:hypothetical protein
VIAVLLGVVWLGEPVVLRDGVGMTLLLVAAFCSLRASVSAPRAVAKQPSCNDAALHRG